MNKSEHNPNDMVIVTKVSTLAKAHGNTASLKCTVPSMVVDLLKLEHGDSLEWIIETGNRIVVTVRKGDGKKE